METSQVVTALLAIVQFGFIWILNRIFVEFEKHRASLNTLFNKLADTREMVLEHRIEILKDHLDQCRVNGAHNAKE